MKIIKEKGITLVALVVTIIILLILAGVTISQVTGNNGLFKKAKEAVERYKNVQEKEQVILDNLDIEGSNKHYIYNKEDLEEFRDNVNKGYSYKGEEVILMDNIDLGGKKEDESTWWQPIGSNDPDNTIYFEGTFEGNNHYIIGLYSEKYKGIDALSFFPSTNNVEIKNLTLDGEFIVGENNDETALAVSGFIGSAIGTTKIENCKNSIDAKKLGASRDAAGFIGGCAGTTILEKCVNEGNIYGTNNCAGLIGSVYENVIISDCYNTGMITNPYGNYIGGLIGRDGVFDESKGVKITITNSYNSGTIAGINRIGGLVGRLGYGTSLELLIDNCHNEGNVLTTSKKGNVGGLIGQIIDTANPCDATICNSWNESDILLNEDDNICVGGLISEIVGGKNVEIINCYNKGDLTCGTTGIVGGLLGRIRDPNNSSPILNITNSYNSGKVTRSKTLTGILYIQHATATVDLINTYYSKASAESGTLGLSPLKESIGKEDSYMKTQAFADELNNNINSIKSEVELKKWVYKEGEYPTLEK